MKTKLSFLIVAISVCMSALAVEVPAKLFVRGTALAESSVAMEMKRINEDFPKFYMGEGSISNTYELFTALKTGSYEFATSACLLYTSPSPRDLSTSRMPSSA